MNPLVSVVIPACNEERWLPAAIASVRRQQVPLELVVVENGSDDATPELAEQLADQVVRKRRRCGYSRARNAGARVARADVLLFLDADSILAPDALEAILQYVRPDVFGTVLGRPHPRSLRYRAFFLVKNLGHRLRLYKGVLGGCMFCHRQLFEAVGGFDPELAADEIFDFSRRARRAGGRHVLVTQTWAATSMRRFERYGMLRTFAFWLRQRLPFAERPKLRGTVYES